MTLTLPDVHRGHRPEVVAAIEAMPSSRLIGLTITGFAPGASVFTLPIRPDLTFDGRHVQAGILGMLADYAAVSAVLTAAPIGQLASTTGCDVQVLEPAAGERLIAIGRCIRVGGRQGVGAADVFAVTGDTSRHVATALATCRLTDLARN
jgi:acyl-coenzyme A thioesterase PaaI-like protein